MTSKTQYVDGYVLVVPKDKSEEYAQMARYGGDMWMKHGALAYFECKGDDLKWNEMGDMKIRTFLDMTDAQDDEEVWFSFITFTSKENRDEVNAKVHEEMSSNPDMSNSFDMPFDMSRMAMGGFRVEVSGEE